MAKVVVTGVAGFLGSHIADAFLADGWDVVGIDNLVGGYIENVPARVNFHLLDLVTDNIDHCFVGADLVVHAACTAYEGLSVFSPSLVVANTVQATTNTVGASIRAGVKRFVYLSSMARYGDHGNKIYHEFDWPRPQDPYGIAKLASEDLVQSLCSTHGVEWVVLVPHNIIGSRQKFDDPYRNVASIMINRMLHGEPPIIYGDGEQTRCFSFVSDVVDPIMVACTSDEAVGEIINIGPDEEPVSINWLANFLADITDFEGEFVYMAGRPQEVKHAVCSADKARALLGYETKHELMDGLYELKEWIEKQPRRDFDYHLPLEIVSDLTPDTWSKKLM